MAQRIRSVLQLGGPGRLIGEQLAIEAANSRAAADRAARAQSEAAQLSFRRQESEAQRQHSLDMAIEELFAQKEAAKLRHDREKEMLGLRNTAAEKAAETAFGRSKELAEHTHQLGFSEREAARKAQKDHWDRMFGQETEQTEIARGAREEAKKARVDDHAYRMKKAEAEALRLKTQEAEAEHRRKLETARQEAKERADAERADIRAEESERNKKLFEQQQSALKAQPLNDAKAILKQQIERYFSKERLAEIARGDEVTAEEHEASKRLIAIAIDNAVVDMAESPYFTPEEAEKQRGHVENVLVREFDNYIDPDRKRAERIGGWEKIKRGFDTVTDALSVWEWLGDPEPVKALDPMEDRRAGKR